MPPSAARLRSAAVGAEPRQPDPGARDVIFVFFGVSWGAAIARGMFTEDRFAKALLTHRRVRRLIVAEPYRSYPGRIRSRVGPWREARFPSAPGRALYAPSRWRRTDPLDPRQAVVSYVAGLRRQADVLGMRRPAVISSHPFPAGFGELDWAGPVTYYGWDDWLASEPHRTWWPAYEDAFAGMRARGVRVCGVTPAIVDRVAPTGPSLVVPNGVEPDEWESPGAPPPWLSSLPRPYVVYAGSLDNRVDVGRIAEVADAFPDGTVIVVGPMLDPDHFDRLRAHANVTIRPPEGRGPVTGLISAADVCLIPHVDNPMTRAMSPLKLYEYLSAGRPVVATALPPIAVAAAGARVVLADAGDDFALAARSALELGPAPEAERRRFIERNSWASRFDEVLDFALAPREGETDEAT